ncbi:uncharacterized protein LOC143468763 [Clavelina lepadiformis]|uniref:MICOS complex subunit n=1 Tax=Clavelina lepadiformis TaxID=159417 RepID=A0ABP0H0Q4_CLALP
MKANCKQDVRNLSIYPQKEDVLINNAQDSATYNHSSRSVGTSVMNLVAEVKEKYRNTVKQITDFKQYATSTEGKVKFSIMAGGLATGLFLAFRSPSKRLYYKRALPLGTLTLAAAACYPYQTYDISKTIARFSYYGSVMVYNGSKASYTYIYERMKKLEDDENASNKTTSTEQETAYVIDERGIVDVSGEDQNLNKDLNKVGSEISDDTNNVKAAESKPEITNSPSDNLLKSPAILNILPMTPSNSAVKTDSAVAGDFGQSSPEDSDLYTTRS